MAQKRIGWLSKLILALLWINFVYLWIRVYRNTWATDYRDSIGYLSILMGTYGLMVTLWIIHNIRIYKKKGPRRGVRHLTYTGSEDALMNQIAYRTDPKGTQEIVIDVIGGVKTFSDMQTGSGGGIPPRNR